MALNYEQSFQDRSEYQGERGPQYRTPDGQPRALTVAERARLMRSAGIADSLRDGSYPDETGVRVG